MHKSAVIIFLFLTLNITHATVWYVHPDSVLNSIQAGLYSCLTSDTVLVAPGTYYENLFWPNTQGILLKSEFGPDSTIIDGSGSGNVIYVVYFVDTTTVVSGFTIQNGSSSWGGGIICNFENSPIITNNVIVTNHADIYGGGIYCEYNAAPNIIYNTITGNTAGSGAGIACADCIFLITIAGNIITNNIANQDGGGILLWDCRSVAVTNNTIIGNTANRYGGGVYSHSSSPAIDSCTISNNNGDGVYCSGGVPVVNYSNITDNIGCGVRNADNVWLNAEYNWWGDSTGPYHPDSNPGGLGDTVSDYVDFIPWLGAPVGVEEEEITSMRTNDLTTTIISGSLLLPKDKKCRIFDITGRVIMPSKMRPGIYFIEIDGEITKKVVKVR